MAESRFDLRMLHGGDVLGVVDRLADLYADVFSGEPWNEGPDDVAAFRDRLPQSAAEPDFRAVVAPDGFATAWRTVLPLPETRSYPRVAEHLGPARVQSLLAGALVVDELAVRPAARGSGLGRRLLSELVGTDRAWLLTSRRAPAAVAFYRRIGWREVPAQPGVESSLVLFITPS